MYRAARVVRVLTPGDGWRRELGDSEVAEAYMDAKFGGEGADIMADMVEIVGGW